MKSNKIQRVEIDNEYGWLLFFGIAYLSLAMMDITNPLIPYIEMYLDLKAQEVELLQMLVDQGK